MSEKTPAFLFYVRDWISSRKVQRLTGDQTKAYIFLLAESWLEEPRATLPSDDESLARLAHVTIEKWMQIKDGLIECFEYDGRRGRYFSSKLLRISKLSDVRRRSANARWHAKDDASRIYAKPDASRICAKPDATPEDENEYEDDPREGLMGGREEGRNRTAEEKAI